MTRCSIIIATYNQAERLEKCLEGLKKTSFPPDSVEIIVVDNNSRDNTESVVRSFSEVKYLKEERQGASYARNRGISESTARVVVFLDADSIPSENWLKNITEPFNDPSVGAVGGAIYPIKKNNIISRYLGLSLFMRYPRYGKKRDIKGYPSCNLAVRKDSIGEGFDVDSFPLLYGEDKDLCYRILKEGKRIVFSPQAVVYHCHAETLKEFFTLLTKSSRGRANFGKKYPYSSDVLLFNFHIPLIYSLLLVYSALFGERVLFLLILSPAILALLYNSTKSFLLSRDIFISFLVKPSLDVVSLFWIYLVYTYSKLKMEI